MNLALFACPFVCPTTKDLRIYSSVFLIFYMKLDSCKVRKVTKCNLWKNVPTSQEGPKTKFLGVFDEYLTYSHVLFLLEYESTNGLLTFCKNHTSVESDIHRSNKFTVISSGCGQQWTGITKLFQTVIQVDLKKMVNLSNKFFASG